MEKLNIPRAASKATTDALGTPLGGFGIIIAVGFLAYLALGYHFPLATSLRLETAPPGSMYIFMLPSILHMVLVASVLAVIGYFLIKYSSPSRKSRSLYWALSLLVVIFQILLIQAQTHDPSPQYNWSILMPEKYLEKSVSTEIIKYSKKDEKSVCDLLLSPEQNTPVSGINLDGIKFSAYPTSAFALNALGGKIPEPCEQIVNFEAASKIAEHYPSLKWFSQQCNALNQSDSCNSTQKNLIKYGAPEKITWRESRFFVSQNTYQLEFVATPDKGILFVKELPVKNSSLGSEDLQKLFIQAESIKKYDAYIFKCGEEKFAKFAKPFSAEGDQLGNWSEKPEAPSYMSLPKGNSVIDGYYSIACK